MACRWIQLLQKNIQLEPTEMLVRPKKVRRGNPAFLDPLTSSRFAVLARSWSCQPTIYRRSVFNLQKRTLPEYWENRKRERVEAVGVEASTFSFVFERTFLCFWMRPWMLMRLRLDTFGVCDWGVFSLSEALWMYCVWKSCVCFVLKFVGVSVRMRKRGSYCKLVCNWIWA